MIDNSICNTFYRRAITFSFDIESVFSFRKKGTGFSTFDESAVVLTVRSVFAATFGGAFVTGICFDDNAAGLESRNFLTTWA